MLLVYLPIRWRWWAFGADSVIELVAGAAILWRLYVEAKGESGEQVEHAERVASWIVGVSLLTLAAYIFVASASSLLSRSHPEANALGIGIAAASNVLMPILSVAKKRIGRTVCSKALVSDGSCSMVCAYMSWILLAGVAATALFGWWWADSIAALEFVRFVVTEGLEAVNETRESDEHEEETTDS